MARRNNNDEIELFHEHGLHIPSRTIKLDQDELLEDAGVTIGPKTASRLIKNLHVLTHISKEPITILMNSPGGSVADGMAMFDAIKYNPCHITIIVLGEACSMAPIILQAADHRLAYPFSRFMLHEGETGYAGHSRDFEKNAEEGKVLRLMTYKILSERTGKKSSYWARKLSRDWFLSAQEALEEGLIDEIIQAQEF